MNEPTEKNDAPTQKLPPNVPVLRALFPNGAATKQTPSTKHLARGLQIAAAQIVELNGNQMKLQAQNQTMAARVDRVESLVLDRINETGEPVAGIASEQRNQGEAIARLNRQLSAALIESTTLSIYNRQYLPAFWEDNKRFPTEAEATEGITEIRKRVKAQADHAAAQQPLWEKLCMAALRCELCVYWKKASKIVLPGQDQEKGRCTQPAIAVICGRCGREHNTPVDPMNVKGKCASCGFDLQREVTIQEATRTCCVMHTPNNETFREFCVQNGLDPEFYDRVANFSASAPQAGEDGVAVPRDPLAKPLDPETLSG